MKTDTNIFFQKISVYDIQSWKVLSLVYKSKIKFRDDYAICLRFQRCVEENSSVMTIQSRNVDSEFSSLSPTFLHLVAVKTIQSKCEHLVCAHFSWVQMETPDGTQNLADHGFLNGCLRHFFLRRTQIYCYFS